MADAMIHILDSQSDVILGVLSNGETTPIWDDVHYQQLANNQETFDFKTIPESPAAEFLRKRNRLIIPTEDGELREFIIEETIQDFDKVEVFSSASHLELKKGKPLAPAKHEGQSLNTMMDIVLVGTGWKRGNTNYSGTETIEFESYVSPFQALQEVTTAHGVELIFRIEYAGNVVTGRYVDAVKRVGDWSGREINSGKDLINATRRENSEEVVTALVGLGPEREDGSRIIVESTNEDARQVWGRNGQHLWGVYEVQSDNQDLTEGQVQNYTDQALAAQIASVIEYTVDGADLEHILGYPHEKIRIGDSVRIKATEYEPPLYLDARVISVETSITDRTNKVYKLGEFIEYDEEDILQLRDYFRLELAKKTNIYYGDTPPANTSYLWIDTSVEPNIVKRYDMPESRWIKATPTEAIEVGAETPQGAQDKANDARDEAKEYAESRSEIERLQGHNVQILKEHTAYNSQYTVASASTTMYTPTVVQELNNAWADYDAKFTALYNVISTVVSDGVISSAERTDIENKTEAYRLAVQRFENAHSDAVEDSVAGKAYDAEQAATDYTEQYAQKEITQGLVAPSNPVTGDLWIDTSVSPYLWKQYNGTAWVKIERTDLSELTGQIGPGQLEDYAVTANKIVDAAIGEAKLANGAVTVDKILDGVVAEAKIAAGAVTELKLGNGAVTNGKLADLAVDAQKLADSSVTTTKIANLAVGTAAIADGAITNAKIDELDAGKITTGRLDAGRIQIGSGTIFDDGYDPTELTTLTIPDTRSTDELPSWYRDNYAKRIITEFKQRAAIGAPSFADADTYGTLVTTVPWGDPSGGPVVQRFTNKDRIFVRESISADTAWSAWKELESTAGSQNKADKALGDAKAYRDLWAYPNTTLIDGGNIYTNSITANQIATGTITASEIASRTITASEIVSGTLTANEIASRTITAAKIVSGSITANELAANSVTASEIAADSVNAAHIAANVIDSNMISTAGLDAGVIKFGTMSGSRIAANTITANHLDVTSLSAISANLGSVTAGSIVGATFKTSNNSKYVELRDDEFRSKGSDGKFININSGRIWAQSSPVPADADVLEIYYDRLAFGSSGGQIFKGSVLSSGNNLLIEAAADIELKSPVIASGNISLSSNNKLLFSSYGGGWMMQDTTWIRSVNNKSIYTANTVQGGTIRSLGKVIADGWINSEVMDPNGSHTYMFIRPNAGGEARITQTGTTGTYLPIRASSFPTGSSVKWKTNIKVSEVDAVSMLKDVTIYDYHLQADIDALIFDKPKIGMLAETVPQLLRDEDGVDPYKIVSVLWKASQNQQERIEALEQQLFELMSVG